MTAREAAIQGMTELGFSEERINSILAHMDAEEPDALGRVNAQLPAEFEKRAVEVAKNYFLRNHSIPMDN